MGRRDNRGNRDDSCRSCVALGAGDVGGREKAAVLALRVRRELRRRVEGLAAVRTYLAPLFFLQRVSGSRNGAGLLGGALHVSSLSELNGRRRPCRFAGRVLRAMRAMWPMWPLCPHRETCGQFWVVGINGTGNRGV